MENFFSGVPLHLDLLKNNMYACGTIQSNRKFFHQIWNLPYSLASQTEVNLNSGNMVISLAGHQTRLDDIYKLGLK